jgi:isoleucyl-tRNA synthetase
MKDIASLVAQFSQQDITEIEKTGKWNTVIDACEIYLELEDFEISAQDIPGWLVASEGGITVALDTTLSPELKNEGIAREIVNRIQNLRKDSAFDVTDRILLKINTSEAIQTAISANKSYICDEVLANEISFEALPNSAFCTDIEAEKDTYIAIQKQ